MTTQISRSILSTFIMAVRACGVRMSVLMRACAMGVSVPMGAPGHAGPLRDEVPELQNSARSIGLGWHRGADL